MAGANFYQLHVLKYQQMAKSSTVYSKINKFTEMIWARLCDSMQSRGVGREKKVERLIRPGRSYGTPEGGPHTPGNFFNLDCKSLILSTSQGDTNYQQTEYFYGF